MQIVIELDEKFYEWLMTKDDTQEVVYKAVRKGIPLPKGHGDLIDKNEITAFLELECNDHNVESLDEFTTIIEADKSVKTSDSNRPKVGEWVVLPPCCEEICYCTACGKMFKQMLQFNKECPNCHAYMKGIKK